MNGPSEENDYTYPLVGKWTDDKNHASNKAIGRCPICSDIIFENEATILKIVHDRCYPEWVAWENRELGRYVGF